MPTVFFYKELRMKRIFSLLAVLAMLGLGACETTGGHDHAHDHDAAKECCSTGPTCCK